MPNERHSPSSMCRVFPRAYYRRNVPWTPHQEGILIRSPSHLFCQLLCFSQMTELFTLSQRESLAILQRKLISHLWFRSFGHYPSGEGRNKDPPENPGGLTFWLRFFLTTIDRCRVHITADIASVHLFTSCSIQVLVPDLEEVLHFLSSGFQPALELSPTFCQQCRPSSDTKRPLSGGWHLTRNSRGTLACTLKDPGEGVELVPPFHIQKKSHIAPFDSEVWLSVGPFSQVPLNDITSEAEKCDPPIVGTHPLIPLRKKRDHHLNLPIQWHCLLCLRNVAELSEPRQPYNIQILKLLWGPCRGIF